MQMPLLSLKNDRQIKKENQKFHLNVKKSPLMVKHAWSEAEANFYSSYCIKHGSATPKCHNLHKYSVNVWICAFVSVHLFVSEVWYFSSPWKESQTRASCPVLPTGYFGIIVLLAYTSRTYIHSYACTILSFLKLEVVCCRLAGWFIALC